MSCEQEGIDREKMQASIGYHHGSALLIDRFVLPFASNYDVSQMDVVWNVAYYSHHSDSIDVLSEFL